MEFDPRFCHFLEYIQHKMGNKTSLSKPIMNQKPDNKSKDAITSFDIDLLGKEYNIPDWMCTGLKKIFSSVEYKNSIKEELASMILHHKSNFSSDIIVDKISMVTNDGKQYLDWHTMYVETFGHVMSPEIYAMSCAFIAQSCVWNKDFAKAKKYIDLCLASNPAGESLAIVMFCQGQIYESNEDYELAIQDYIASYKAKTDSNVVTKLAQLVKSRQLEVVMCRKMMEAVIELKQTKLELAKISAENKELLEKLYWSPSGPGMKRAESHFVESLDT